MTALLLSDIPSNINQVEEILIWAATALVSVNPTKQVLETENSSEFAARFFVSFAQDGTTRFVTRISIPIDPTYVSDKSKKFWEFANFISDTALPASFKSN